MGTSVILLVVLLTSPTFVDQETLWHLAWFCNFQREKDFQAIGLMAEPQAQGINIQHLFELLSSIIIGGRFAAFKVKKKKTCTTILVIKKFF